MDNIKTVVELPKETVEKIVFGLSQIGEIKEALQELGGTKTPEHYTVKEFMERAKIGRNKFESIKYQLNSVRVSPRKILIPHSELLRWFRGEIQSK